MQLNQLLCSAGLTVFAFTGFVEPSAAQAYPDYPYCAHYGGRDVAPGTPVCGFNTREQCLAAVSGTQGFCEPNLWYQGPSVTRRRR